MSDAIEVIVKSQTGDVVVAEKQYDFLEEIYIKVGEEWTVTDKFGMFVKIKRGDKEYWFDDLTFTRIFEGAE